MLFRVWGGDPRRLTDDHIIWSGVLDVIFRPGVFHGFVVFWPFGFGDLAVISRLGQRHVYAACWVTVEIRVGEESGRSTEVHDREELFAMLRIEPGAASDDLFELRHRPNVELQDDELDRFDVDACGEQFRCGHQCRVLLVDVSEVIELTLAFFIISGDLHDVPVVLDDPFKVLVR